MKKRRKLNIQKAFCTISAGFIIGCCIFYGYKFITLYLENKKSLEQMENKLAKEIKSNNEDDESFKNINGKFYFTGKTDDNYLVYSNMLWRIVKINDNNSIKLISEDIISYLGYGKDVDKFSDSYIGKWLNDTNTGVLINQLDNTHLITNDICNDKITKASNTSCKNVDESSKIGLLNIEDYINAGSDKSYLNTEKFYYLSSINNKEVWYVNSKGKLKSEIGDKLYGIRPTITIKGDIPYTKGDGTLDNPYIINTDSIFASYVKLDNDIYRVYDVNDEEIKLSLNDYIKVGGQNLEHIYSNKTYYHNDTDRTSLAGYLNNTYLNSLSYKTDIIETKWHNGILNENMNYTSSLNTQIDTKVANLSIGNIILNTMDNYFLMTGNTDKTKVYTVKENGSLKEINVDETAYIVPTITIKKQEFTKGNGSLAEPYER